MRNLLVLALFAWSLSAGGCVFWDIRDEVRNTNSRLDTVESRLAGTNQGLDRTNSKLEGVNTELKGVETSLERLDATNQSLSNVEERLALLRSLDASLARVDVHLASLRKTIGRIDGMIPFLDLGTEGEPEPEAGPPAGQVAAAESTPAASDGGAPAKSAPPRRDALVGVWISQYPDRSTVVVLQEGGRYALQRSSRAAPPGSGPAGTAAEPAPIETGSWKRDGKRLELTGEPREVTRPDGTRVTASAARSWEIVSQSVKSLALRSEAEGLLVFAKP